jgi:hypothetical protein
MSSFKDKRPWGRMFENQLPEYLDLVVAEPEDQHEDAEFVLEMVKHSNAQLKPQGLQCFFMGPTVSNQGYRMGFCDAERHRYYIGFTYDEAITLGENYAGRAFQELLTLVCERALLARHLEFEKKRASASLSLSLEQVVQENVPS